MRKTLGVFAVLSCVACGSEGMGMRLEEQPVQQFEAERWSPADDPTRLGGSLEFNLARLPLDGTVAKRPWVGSYWPVALDSINYPWAGYRSASAAEKYERAFGGYRVEDAVSRYHGIDSVGMPSCASDGECSRSQVCARRRGRAYGRCIPGWWGLCHAWAAAALLMPEPQHPVTYNGVQFRVQDLKALATVVHHHTKALNVSLRCNDSGIRVDGVGRPVDPTCRDTNPGTFHVLLANLLGKRGQSFLEDRSMDGDVWNQPILKYHVVSIHEVSEREANAWLEVPNQTYPYNRQAKRFVHVITDVFFLRESTAEIDGMVDIRNYTFKDRYAYILELDRDGNIIGGEWARVEFAGGRRTSKTDHPDFLWVPIAADTASAAGGAISYKAVMDLVSHAY
jgi:hypothetical protein